MIIIAKLLRKPIYVLLSLFICVWGDAIGSFSKGDFIVEYRGDLISDGEAQKRRRIYNPACSGFLFAFKLGGKTWW